MSFRFNCYYPAEKPRFFIVKLDLEDGVFDLVSTTRKLLLSEYGITLSHDDIQLFKACLAFSSD